MFRCSLVSVTAQCLCFHLQTGSVSIDNLKITATPDILVDYTQSVTLSVTGTESLPSKGLTFEWRCGKYNNELTTKHFKRVLTVKTIIKVITGREHN